jgi:Uma2 family endonuclease
MPPFLPLRTRPRRADPMGMPAMSTPTYWTVADVLALPDDGNRYELAYGKLLVSPSPRVRHQVVAGRLYVAVASYCEQTRVGVAPMSPGDITWGRDDVLVQPDVFVIAAAEAHLRDWKDFRQIPLTAEVLSHSTRSHDRFEKRGVYRDMRVQTYWVVEADEHYVEVWTPEAHFPAIERERLVWAPDGTHEPLEIELRWLFGA